MKLLNKDAYKYINLSNRRYLIVNNMDINKDNLKKAVAMFFEDLTEELTSIKPDEQRKKEGYSSW